ncbi:hypothetical protein R1flu_015870 [Riccia fluitans]|uniref:Uncharacterized protein n=1 Tax=Riccia fluitans TaxID=41844 RepID=A0ABD1YL85_9MARC
MDLNRPFWRSNDLGYLQLGQGQNVVPETLEVYLNFHDLGSTQTPDLGGGEDPMQNDQPPQESVPRSVPPQDPVPIPESGLPAWIAVGIQYSPDDLRKYFLCDGKVWHSKKLNIEFHCSHPVLKNNWKKWMRAANPTWNRKSTQVRKSFVFFAGLELHGIKIDWSIVNVHKGINRYSAKEKEKARKELWHMQVKFEGELCEPIDLDTRKRHRTSGSRTSNKHSRESENTESRERAKQTEVVASGSDGPDQVLVDQGRTHMPCGDAPADPSPLVDKGEAKVDNSQRNPSGKTSTGKMRNR